MTILPIGLLQPLVVHAGILGFKTWFVELVGGVVAVIVVLYVVGKLWDSRKHEQNIKKIMMPDGKTRRINGVFITEGQTGYERLCDCDMNVANVPPKDKKKDIIGKISAPKVTSQRIPDYYLYSGYGIQIWWPKNAKPTQQVQIMQFFYRENYPFPDFAYKGLSNEEREAMTGILANIQADQGVANAVVTEVQQKFEAFTRALKELWAWRPFRWVLLGIAGGVVINVFLTFQVFRMVNMIGKFLIGS